MTSTPVTFFDVEPIAEALANGLLLLTPNQRLASRISNAYAVFCAKNGHKVVVAPAIKSLEHWLDECWELLLLKADPAVLSKSLLTPEQELCLWQRVVADSESGAGLLRPANTASQLRSAYNALHEWQLDYDDAAIANHFSGEDDQIVRDWFKAFDQYCDQGDYLPAIRKTSLVIDALTDGRLAGVEQFSLYGFEDLSPRVKALLSVVGEEQAMSFSSATKSSVTVVACESAEQEAQAAAAWARQIVRENNQARIAVVIPDLAQDRQRVLRLFQEAFESDFSQAATKRQNTPFNFSAGYPLSEAPVIKAALQGLSLTKRLLDVDSLILFLQSPFFLFANNDQGSVAWLINLIKNDRQFQISAARFRQLVEKVDQSKRQNQKEGWPFAEALISLATLVRTEKVHVARPAQEWLGFVEKTLQLLGWPGPREADTVEYQELKQWVLVLQQFARLGDVSSNMTFDEALSQLTQIVHAQVFQPEAPESSLQVLGLLEAAGLQFDYLWLTSMSASQWPPSPSPNPLLPFSLQREWQMPHASAERELQYATNLSLRFIKSAGRVAVSYAKTINDNPAEVSRLYRDYPQTLVNEFLAKPLHQSLPLITSYHALVANSYIETFEPGNAPALNEQETIHGGSSLFASQAACPFKAFSKHRLGLRSVDDPQVGLNAADRGSILHRALELIWKKLKDSQSLQALDDAAQLQLCNESAQYTLSEFSQYKLILTGARFMAVELERLSQLLNAWLNVERQRAPFTVLETEAKHAFRFHDLDLKARIDRVDQLSDGSFIIVDYKTGKSNVNAWWGDRPDDPQLPLYGHIIEQGDSHLSGLAFAQVRLDGCEIKGVGEEDLPEPKLQWNKKIQSDAGARDWPELKQHWQRVLHSLAEDFISGQSRVDPKHSVNSCQYCEYASLCRVGVEEGDLQ